MGAPTSDAPAPKTTSQTSSWRHQWVEEGHHPGRCSGAPPPRLQPRPIPAQPPGLQPRLPGFSPASLVSAPPRRSHVPRGEGRGDGRAGRRYSQKGPGLMDGTGAGAGRLRLFRKGSGIGGRGGPGGGGPVPGGVAGTRGAEPALQLRRVSGLLRAERPLRAAGAGRDAGMWGRGLPPEKQGRPGAVGEPLMPARPEGRRVAVPNGRRGCWVKTQPAPLGGRGSGTAGGAPAC